MPGVLRKASTNEVAPCSCKISFLITDMVCGVSNNGCVYFAEFKLSALYLLSASDLTVMVGKWVTSSSGLAACASSGREAAKAISCAERLCLRLLICAIYGSSLNVNQQEATL